MNNKKGNPRPPQTGKVALFPDLCELLHFVAMLKDSLEVFHEKFERNAKELFELGYLPILEEDGRAENQTNAAKILVRLLDYDPLEKDKDKLKDIDCIKNSEEKFAAAKKLLQNYCKGIFEFKNPTEEDAKNHVVEFVKELFGHEIFEDDAEILGFDLKDSHGFDIKDGEAFGKFILDKYAKRFQKTELQNSAFETLPKTFDYGNYAQKTALHILYSGLEPKAKRQLHREIFRKAVNDEKRHTKKGENGEKAVRTSKLLSKMEETSKSFGMLTESANPLAKNEKLKASMRKRKPVPAKVVKKILKLLPEGLKKRIALRIKDFLEAHKDKCERFGNSWTLKQLKKIAEEHGGIPMRVRNSEKTIGEVLDEANRDLYAPEKSEELDKAFEEFGRGSEHIEAAVPSLILDAEEGREFFGLGTEILGAVPEIRSMKLKDLLSVVPSDFLPKNKAEEEAERITAKPEKSEFKNLEDLLNFIHEKRDKQAPKNALSDRRLAWIYLVKAAKAGKKWKFTTKNPWEWLEIFKFHHEFFPKEDAMPRFLFENLSDFTEFVREREATKRGTSNQDDVKLTLKYLLEAHDFDSKDKVKFIPRTVHDVVELYEFFSKVDSGLKANSSEKEHEKLKRFVAIGNPIFVFKSLDEFVEFAQKDSEEAGKISGETCLNSRELAKKFLLNPYKKLCVKFAPETKEAAQELDQFLREMVPEKGRPKQATFTNLQNFLEAAKAWNKQSGTNASEGDLLLLAQRFLDANGIACLKFTTKKPLEIVEHKRFFQLMKLKPIRISAGKGPAKRVPN